MKDKKVLFIALAFVVVIALFAGIYFLTRPETSQGSKAYTVTVIHADGSQKVFNYRTDEEYLDKALLAEGLIEGYEDQYGLVIEKVDGEAAIWDTDNAYWSLYEGETYATTGISATPVHDGSVFKLVYETFSPS